MDLIDSGFPDLGMCARGPGWSENGKLRLTSSSGQGNRRTQGETFSQVWWTSLVKRPNCVTKVSIFVNDFELDWLTEPREPLNYQSPIPTTKVTLRIFYKDPIVMWLEKCFEVRVLFELPESRRDHQFEEGRHEGRSSNYLAPPGPRTSVEFPPLPRSSIEDFDQPQRKDSSRNRGRSLLPPRDEVPRLPNDRGPSDNQRPRNGFPPRKDLQDQYLPPTPNLQPPGRDFIIPPESYKPNVRRGRKLPSYGPGPSIEQDGEGPTQKREPDAVNFPDLGRKQPEPGQRIPTDRVETSSVRNVHRAPSVPSARAPDLPDTHSSGTQDIRVRSNLNDETSSEDLKVEDATFDAEIIMGTVGLVAVVLVGALTVIVRRVRRHKTMSSSSSGRTVKSAEVWSPNDSKRRKLEKEEEVEKGEEYFVGNSYENTNHYRQSEVYENENQYQNS